MSDSRLYNELAWIWEVIVSEEEYPPEVEFLKKMIQKHKKTLGNELLDVGCGAGHHDLFLKQEYNIVGLDRHEKMLEHARRRNPEVTYIVGDMRLFKLHREFDIVMAMDMIMYNLNYSDLEKTLKNFYHHLKIGGILLFFFEEMKKTFEQNRTSVSKPKKRGKTEIVVIENDYDEDKNDTEYESTLIFLIREGGKLQIEVDKHRIGIFELDRVLEILDELDFKTKLYEMDFQEKEYEKKGPFFVCQKL